jgi:hypothetical protein
MNINFENLDSIPQMFELIKNISSQLENKVEKRWLSTKETAEYLGYSVDSVNSMVKKFEFIEGLHFYQKARKRMFDKSELDNWVMGITPVNNQLQFKINSTIDDIISSVA